MVGWPIVGHASTLRRLVDLPADRPGGAVLVGPAGVGKTTVARAAVAAMVAEGMTARWLRPTREMARIPLGVLAPSLPPLDDTSGPTVDHVTQARAALRALAGGGELVLVVDDAHLLDELSAAVVHLCVAVDGIRTIVTLRSGERPPDAIVRLWKDGLADRIELNPLSRDEVDELIAASLGGPVDPALAHDVWRRTGGNPLFVRELVGAGVDDGSLQQEGGVWCGARPLRPPASLSDLLLERLDDLGPGERAAFDLVLVGEPLDASVLEELAPTAAVAELERRRMVTIEPGPDAPVARLAHPLFAEIGATLLPVTDVRALKRRLAASLSKRSALGDPDRTRIVRWRLDAGEEMPVEDLVAGAEAAMRLADLDLAERAIQLAHEREPTVRSGVLLSRVLLRRERPAEAAAVLEALEALAVDDLEVATIAQSRSQSLSYGLGRHDLAGAALQSAADRVTEDAARDLLLWNQGAIHLYAGRPLDAIETVRPLLDRADGAVLAFARLISAVAHLVAGNLATAVDLADTVQAMSPSPDRVDLVGEGRIADIVRMLARLDLGNIDVVRETALATHERWSLSAEPLYGHWLSYTLGRANLLAGQTSAAATWFRHAHQGGAVLAPDLLNRWARGNRAYALVLGGRHDDAQKVLDDAAACGDSPFPDDGAARAEAWLLAAAGHNREALRRLESTCQAFAERGLRPFECTLRHDQVRLGAATERVVARLAELANGVDGPLTDLRARHARALAAGDAERLAAVGEGFASAGAALFAAEALAQASSAAPGRTADAHARRARELASRCDVAATPALLELGMASPLTPRERSIATLAASGAPSKDIARQLGVSARTVDNTLQRVFVKLGVSRRHDLPAALGEEPG